MINADLLTFKHVCDQISFINNKSQSEQSLKEFHIIVIPNLMFTFKNLLENEGLDGLVQLHRFSWDFNKIDRNLLSLEIPHVFRDVFVRGDKSILSSIATSLRIFGFVHGKPKLTVSYGENSGKVLEMVSRMEKSKAPRKPSEFPDFSVMFVMDRDKDFPSCLLTPVTYSALMVELFEMSAGTLTIDAENNKMRNGKLEIFKGKPSEDEEVKTLRMCGSSDELYTYNKYRHFSEVVNLIKSESKNLEEERSKYNRNMDIEQMKEFVQQNLPKVAAQKKVLYKHLILCEKIVQEMSGNFERQQNIEETVLRCGNRKQILAYIDEQLFTNPHQWNSLRLMCLFHVCCGGLGVEDSNKFIGSYLNTFGHKNLGVFQNLTKAKLFPDITKVASKNLIGISLPQRKTQFQNDVGKLKLISGDASDDPKSQKVAKACPSYVFNGNYIPLIAQLSNFLMKSESFAEFSSKFNHLDNFKVCAGDELETSKDSAIIFPIKPRTLFIFVIGGITYAEIAATNMVESLTGSKIVLASDRIVSGIDMMRASSIS
jgi:hypothetical protein